MSNRLTAPVLIREEGDARRSTSAAFGGGAIIGALGGLIGLGGAEFRLPLLIGAFRFAALQAMILNKAMSLVPRRCGSTSDGGRSWNPREIQPMPGLRGVPRSRHHRRERDNWGGRQHRQAVSR